MAVQRAQASLREKTRILVMCEDTAARDEIIGHLHAALAQPVVELLASADQLDRLSPHREYRLCIVYLGRANLTLNDLDRVRERQAACPILLVLEAEQEALAVEAMNRSADAYIIKTPQYKNRLRAAVTNLIRVADQQHSTLKSLKRSERQLHDVVRNAAQGILIQIDGSLVFANSASASLLGFETPGDVLAVKRISEIVDVRDISRFQRFLEQGSKASGGEVIRFRRADGTLLWLESHATETTWQGQSAMQYTILDVSDRQRARNALRLSAKVANKAGLYDDFSEAIGVALRWLVRGMGWELGESWVPSPAGDTLLLGPYHCREPERSRDFIARSRGMQFEPGEGLPGRVWRRGRPEWIGDVSTSPELFRRHFAASEAGLKAACAVPVVAQDQTVAVLCFYMSEERLENPDLTESLAAATAALGAVLLQIKTEKARRESIAQTETLISRNADGILVVGDDHQVLFANPASQEILGRSIDSLLGTVFQVPEGKAEIEIHDAEGRMRTNEIRSVDIVWHGRHARLVSLHDVTERREANAVLRKHQMALQERVKELRCLYSVSEHLVNETFSWQETLRNIVNVVPAGFQYPEIACVRLKVEDIEVTTVDFHESAWQLSDDVLVDEEKVGRLEVHYLEERPECDIGPFLNEERDLIGEIARRTGQAITARHSQQELNASRRRFQNFAEAASDWLWEMDEHLRFTYFSDRIETVMGQPVDHWIGKTRSELTPEDVKTDPKWASHLRELKAHKPFKNFRYEISLPNGGTRHISISGIPIFDERDRFKGYRGTGTDESQEVEARNRAQESELRLQGIGDRLPGVLFQRLKKADGTVVYPYLSAGTFDMFGYESREILKDPLLWTDAIYPEDRPRFDVAVAESSSTLEPMDLKFRMLTRSGDVCWVWHRSQPRRMENGDTVWDCIELDITEQKRIEARLQFLGYHDQLTGLPNRELFVERINQILPIASRNQQSVAVGMLGLKRFKKVNEEFGMSGGDEVLRIVAERFKRCLRPGDTVARLGGDRFLFLLPSVGTESRTHKPLKRLVEAMEESITVNQKQIVSSFNMGITVFPGDGDSPEELIQKADTAQAHYARWGPGFGYTFYQNAMPNSDTSLLALEKDLRDAIETPEQLQAYFQPIFDARTRKLIAVETLARWQHPHKGLLPPAEFIELAEETGLIMPLGLSILADACRHARKWEDNGLPGIRVTVNLSAAQLREEGLARSIKSVLEDTGMPPDRLVLEVTESTLIRDLSRATEFMDELRAAGVSFALDDFGVGYSSLSYLGRLPVQVVKIDRSFVRELHKDPRSETTIKAMIALGHALELHVVAEGIETREHLEHVKRLGCDSLQGFLLGKPMPAAELEVLLSRNEPATELETQTLPPGTKNESPNSVTSDGFPGTEERE